MREAMRRRRDEMGCSLTDIAPLADVTPGFLGKIERGEKDPSAATLEKLEAAYGLPAAVLMGWETSQPVPTGQADI